jgi:hypothetical protein
MIIAFYELLPGKSRPEKQALNVHPHLEAPLPSIGDLVCFEGVGETEVPGWFRVRSRVFSHGQIPGVEPTLAITIVVERIEDENELTKAGVKRRP